MDRMKPGGTEGGTTPFLAGAGLLLAAIGVYLLLDSVQVSSSGAGTISRWLVGAMGGWETTSRGIIFLPLVLGVVALFYNAKLKAGWWLLWGGLGIVIVEILSRLVFHFSMKTSHLILLLGTIAAGVGLVLRGLRESAADRDEQNPS